MVEERELNAGEFVRRNRRIARIQRISGDRVHLRILQDLSFRVYESEVISLSQAPRLLRRFPQGFYSQQLFETPDRIEEIREGDTGELMRLILSEYQTAFGKREFRQILVLDDGVVAEEKWNSFWSSAYRDMRSCKDFKVDDKGRYSLA
ncbi:MAG: hypothetical protein ACYTFG_08585 [Planctomycetota bacterium]|jgi:transcription elongation factor GreA-like protein